MRAKLALAAALAALTLVVYAPAGRLEFVNYDDNVYVVDNARVAQGLSWDNAVWSLTAFENGNWHPLTLLSHMLDVTLFGLDGAAHHRVNLALHLVNVLLLFLLLADTTSKPWPAALVAALFAIHPLNVQTVAWVSERKSLLSTAFWIGALIVHARHRRRPKPGDGLLVVGLAALALAAKPMAVTLPLTIALIDFWPIGKKLDVRGPMRDLAPTTVLCVLCGLLTIKAQRAVNAIQPMTEYPFLVRLGNAVVSYVWYLVKLAWPSNLAAFYPHPRAGLDLTAVFVSAMLLLGICAAVVAIGRRFAPLSMGWWWYVGTLLPVVGLIQVGAQAHADRYAYVPLVGIFVIVAWSVESWTEKRPALRKAAVVVGICWVAALSIVTRAQIAYWHDSVALFTRAIEVVPDNSIAHNNLGMALVERGKLPDALPHFQKAVELTPDDTDARSNLGNALRTLGRPAEAVPEYQKAMEQSPNDPTIHYNLATALLDLGRVPEAVAQLQEALRLNPDYEKARALLERVTRPAP